ncbi:methyltransferase domain-containing protein [Candidatus Halobeggiatoa sp. HSG11]|nr:methyltransferase domain-containing protein [Candidatus Halobeggiatoa sp. HSG11]
MNNDYNNIKKYYDDYGTWYDKERDNTYYYSLINDIETGVVREYATDKKTLEIGCGTGIILSQVNKFTQESWGIDLSSGMLEAAKKKNLNVKEANAVNIPFDDKKFDVVYSFKVLAHIPNIQEVIAEIYRVLDQNGIAILEFYNPISFKALTNKIAGTTDKVYIRYDSLSDIRELLGEQFDIIDIRGARIITPFAFILKIPILNKILILLEHYLSKTFFNRMAGYFIVVACKK